MNTKIWRFRWCCMMLLFYNLEAVGRNSFIIMFTRYDLIIPLTLHSISEFNEVFELLIMLLVDLLWLYLCVCFCYFTVSKELSRLIHWWWCLIGTPDIRIIVSEYWCKNWSYKRGIVSLKLYEFTKGIFKMYVILLQIVTC